MKKTSASRIVRIIHCHAVAFWKMSCFGHVFVAHEEGLGPSWLGGA